MVVQFYTKKDVGWQNDDVSGKRTLGWLPYRIPPHETHLQLKPRKNVIAHDFHSIQIVLKFYTMSSILPCSGSNYKMMGQLRPKIQANEILQELKLG